MSSQFSDLRRLPIEDGGFPVPVTGLVLEIMTANKALASYLKRGTIRLPKCKAKHRKASDRMVACAGYIITSHDRLLGSKRFFMEKHLDFEVMKIYSQVLLDSFAVLIPFFYGYSEKYSGLCPACKSQERDNSVDSFNNLRQWIEYHKIDDEFTKRYLLIRKEGWYKQMNQDRRDYIHGRITPLMAYADQLEETSITEDLLVRDRKPAEILALKEEMKSHLKHLFDFLMFSESFFKDKLKQRDFPIVDMNRHKLLLPDVENIKKTLLH